MPCPSDLDGLLHRFNLSAVLEQTHLVQDHSAVHNFSRIPDPAALLLPNPCEDPQDRLIEIRIDAQATVDPLRVLEQLDELGFQLPDLQGNIGAKLGARPLQSRSTTVPDLPLRVAFLDKQIKLGLCASLKDSYRMGLDEARDVLKVGTLPIIVIHVTIAHRHLGPGHDEHRAPKLLKDPFTATDKL